MSAKPRHGHSARPHPAGHAQLPPAFPRPARGRRRLPLPVRDRYRQRRPHRPARRGPLALGEPDLRRGVRRGSRAHAAGLRSPGLPPPPVRRRPPLRLRPSAAGAVDPGAGVLLLSGQLPGARGLRRRLPDAPGRPRRGRREGPARRLRRGARPRARRDRARRGGAGPRPEPPGYGGRGGGPAAAVHRRVARRVPALRRGTAAASRVPGSGLRGAGCPDRPRRVPGPADRAGGGRFRGARPPGREGRSGTTWRDSGRLRPESDPLSYRMHLCIFWRAVPHPLAKEAEEPP